ncbi:hypothetical protein HY989_03310 [Candidatus Micrarchaeota archaeon]|nr:hypothetical protein [Candidatus Micrarchaeota archaeon]
MASATDDLKRELPHIIVLAILVFILLFVVTKFKWVSCTDVPGDWCSVYCSVAGNSRVGIIEGEGGIGNSNEFAKQITKNRIFTYAESLPINGISAGVLKKYELVIMEGAKRIRPVQVNALKDYVSTGGSLLWVGDAGTEHYLSEGDIGDALYRNESNPGYYEDVVKKVNRTKGFGDSISQILQIDYLRTEEGNNLTLTIISKDHAVSKGLNREFTINAKQLAVVNSRSGDSSVLAYAYGTKSCTKEKPCPAIIVNRYTAPVAYVAFPIEEGGSKSLITNLMDYLVTC